MPGQEVISALAPWPGIQVVAATILALVSILMVLRGQKDGKSAPSPAPPPWPPSAPFEAVQISLQGPINTLIGLLTQINDTLRRTEDNQRNVRTELDTQTRDQREQTSEHLSAMSALVRKIEELIGRVEAVLAINTTILSRVDEMLRRK